MDPNFQEKVQDSKGDTTEGKGITLDKEQVKEKNKEHKKKKGFC